MPLRLSLAFILTGCTMLSTNAADAPIRYTLRFPRPQTHYVEVEAIFPTAGRPEVEVLMAVWTPGSYLVREYARNVEGLAARSWGGQPLEVEKVRKNRWRIATSGESEVALTYRVYGREMSVQANWIDRSFALLNGAATFLTLAGNGPRAHEVTLVPPADWPRTITSLPGSLDGQPHRYVAPDFDTLVDSPIYAGNPAVYTFEVDGKVHLLVNEGEGGSGTVHARRGTSRRSSGRKRRSGGCFPTSVMSSSTS